MTGAGDYSEIAMTAVSLIDRVPVSGIRKDSAGNLIAIAKAARTGIQEYAGYELGQPDKSTIRVYRPEEEVFNRDSMRSFAGVPVTIDHPPVMVDSANWKEYAVGESASDEIVRDGEYVRVPFIVRDAEGQKAIEDGKHEISMGYGCDIDFTAGQTPKGEAYDAVARNFRMNHLAVVDKARAGPSCRIGDSEPKDKPMKKLVIDSIPVELDDAAEAVVSKLLKDRDTLAAKVTETETLVADKQKELDEATGKVTALESQLKDANDPAKLQAAAEARSALVDKAKAVVPAIVTDGKSDSVIQKEVVVAKLGDSAAGFNDDQIKGAFATLTAGVKLKTQSNDSTKDVKDALLGGGTGGDDIQTLLANRDKAKSDMLGYLSNPRAKTE